MCGPFCPAPQRSICRVLKLYEYRSSQTLRQHHSGLLSRTGPANLHRLAGRGGWATSCFPLLSACSCPIPRRRCGSSSGGGGGAAARPWAGQGAGAEAGRPRARGAEDGRADAAGRAAGRAAVAGRAVAAGRVRLGRGCCCCCIATWSKSKSLCRDGARGRVSMAWHALG